MNNLTSELKILYQSTLNNLNSSKSKNTLRAYESDFRDFQTFCSKHSLSCLPSNPKVVSLYLTYLSNNLRFSTIKRRLASLTVVHKIKGYYLDNKHPIIRENLLAIRRSIGNYQKPKKPLLINNLKMIINLIDNEISHDMRKLRDKSIILIGFAGGFRRSELVSIDYEDLEFVPEGVKINLKKSKTDQFGEGMTKGLPYSSSENYCAVTNLKKWLDISKIKSGPIFRKFKKNTSLTERRLTDQSVVLLLKNYLSLAGIENEDFAGHSLRSGFATVAADSGADERSIMAMTGHKTTQMVRRYIREANIFKNNALSKIKI